LGSHITTCLKIGFDLSISVSLTVLGCLLATSVSWFTNLPDPTHSPTVSFESWSNLSDYL